MQGRELFYLLAVGIVEHLICFAQLLGSGYQLCNFLFELVLILVDSVAQALTFQIGLNNSRQISVVIGGLRKIIARPCAQTHHGKLFIIIASDHYYWRVRREGLELAENIETSTIR